MAVKTIHKTIDIKAPKEQVWNVLFGDSTYQIWTKEFSESSYAETDWKEGSKAVFKDNTNSGLVGRIIQSQPYDLLSIEYDGELKNGVEDFESEASQSIKGGRETYKLSEQDGATRLIVASDMDESYFDTMSEAWDRALLKVKELAETK
jgi:uncharacterized protein YndB with AHSA1/START domain